ncbi:uncharacterized protein N7483_002524 [Penicillium malachiteum]|uniref:uncharacterized protein n=1 Tax=Penicillium malachiteum TaxID=1324776 RepID=UPI0025489A23|nr:uncharacterized protein N7483_002524 [Penicillium malachiteum]KAJ5737399.1 hypothetical protein N7483_002524 [Penicillium malachiteum]
MMFEVTCLTNDEIPRHGSLPPLKSVISGTNEGIVCSAPRPQVTVQSESSWSQTGIDEMVVSPSSAANLAESSWQEFSATQKAAVVEWSNNFSGDKIMSLVAPINLNRKQPLQQICGHKRKGSAEYSGPHDKRENHRIAERNRRKNLSQLHRELDSRIHDFFLERAGWKPSKILPQSKQHIVQGAIYLIDFMMVIIVHLIRQDQVTPQPIQLQQQVSSLNQQNKEAQQQLHDARAEGDLLTNRNRALKSRLRYYEQRLRSYETTNSGLLVGIPERKSQKEVLPGFQAFLSNIRPGTYTAEEPRA